MDKMFTNMVSSAIPFSKGNSFFRSSLRPKLIVFFSVLFTLLSLFNFLYYPQVFKKQSTINIKNFLYQVSEMLALTAGISFELADFDSIQTTVEWAKTDKRLSYLGIFDGNNNEVAAFKPTDLNLDINNMLIQTEINEINDNLFLAVPINYNGRNHGKLLLGLSLDELNAKIAENKLNTLYISLAIFSIGLVVIYILSNMIIRPILNLVYAANEVSKGNTEVDIQISTSDEIGELGACFQEMVQNIKTRTSELLTANEQLRKLSLAAEQSPSSIIITDTEGKIEYVNPKFTQLSGYTLHELLGKNPKILTLDNKPEDEYKAIWKTITSGREWRSEFLNKKKDGSCYWGLAAISGVKDLQGNITHYISSIEDITEKNIYQKKIESALREKEILMKEINHRAKNNMQIISSLIKMQSRDAFDEPKLIALLRNLRNRITAMSLVHDQIFDFNDLSKIDTRRYICNLANNVRRSFGQIAAKVELIIRTNDTTLNVDKCIHCGLIINELITNSLKYAFPAEQDGLIEVVLRNTGNGEVELFVSDNGVGIGEDVDIRDTKSLGMRLVTTLAEKQLHGRIELSRGHGTRFKIVFPE